VTTVSDHGADPTSTQNRETDGKAGEAKEPPAAVAMGPALNGRTETDTLRVVIEDYLQESFPGEVNRRADLTGDQGTNHHHIHARVEDQRMDLTTDRRDERDRLTALTIDHHDKIEKATDNETGNRHAADLERGDRIRLVQHQRRLVVLNLLRYETLNRYLTRQQRPNSYMDTLAYSPP
jgi:hypothetical protein